MIYILGSYLIRMTTHIHDASEKVTKERGCKPLSFV